MKNLARSLALLSAATLAAGLTATGGAAVASPAHRGTGEEILAKNLTAPLSVAVAKDGSAYVSANFAGTLLHVTPGEKPVTVYQSKEKGGEVGAVSVYKNRVVFGTTGAKKWLWQSQKGGKPTKLANVGKYEATVNPDQDVAYGLQGDVPADCLAQWPAKQNGPAQYTGIVDSHPYASETTATKTYLADAAANAILSITPSGKIKTVAVLPPTPVVITADAAAASKLPDCVIGLTYYFEPVPTDVELGPDGKLYVTSLPGGPEDGSTGPQGRVYKVSPGSGHVSLVASGFISTVDLAVANNGDIYVAQLFTGVISRIKAGSHKAKDFMQLSMPGAIEWTKDYLYATTDVLKGTKVPQGKLVRIPW